MTTLPFLYSAIRQFLLLSSLLCMLPLVRAQSQFCLRSSNFHSVLNKAFCSSPTLLSNFTPSTLLSATPVARGRVVDRGIMSPISVTAGKKHSPQTEAMVRNAVELPEAHDPALGKHFDSFGDYQVVCIGMCPPLRSSCLRNQKENSRLIRRRWQPWDLGILRSQGRDHKALDSTSWLQHGRCRGRLARCRVSRSLCEAASSTS